LFEWFIGVGQVDRYSFLVRLFHPLLHAGLSRRTNIAIALIDRLVVHLDDSALARPRPASPAPPNASDAGGVGLRGCQRNKIRDSERAYHLFFALIFAQRAL